MKTWIITWIDCGSVYRGNTEAYDAMGAINNCFTLPGCYNYNIIKVEQVNTP